MKNLAMKYLPLIFASLCLIACNDTQPTLREHVPQPVVQVDTLYTNGVIWTGEKNAPAGSVLAIKDGVITYVGHGEAGSFEAEKTHDLNGRFLMPGFIDNHVHLFDGGAGLASVDLRDASTPSEFSKRIADFAKTVPQGRWILIGNWDHELWGGELPHKNWIDEASGDIPVFVMRIDGHMALANSAALKIANINLDTPIPEGGEIKRDKDEKLSGILKDNAMNLVFDVIPKPSDDELVEIFKLAQDHALSLGITQMHVLIGYPHETDQFDSLKMIDDRGVIKVRVHSYTPISDRENGKHYAQVEQRPDSKLKWAGFKGFVDGSLGSTTAWFYEPYVDAPETSGFAINDPAEFKTIMQAVDSEGHRMAIHAIGDKAIDQVLTDMQNIASDEIKQRRYRIEHFQHPSAQAIKTAADKGVILAMHPYHAIDDGRWAEERIGPERIKTTYAFRSILDAGGILSFGSDWPVAPLSPLEGVYAAVTRRTTDGAHPNGWQPQEKISVEEALTAYTSTNAYLGFEEDVAGTLAEGKRADFVILSNDPREVDPVSIRDIKLLSTVIDGEVVYDINSGL